MGTLKEYKCNSCGYTITGTRKGRTLVMSGEIETTKVPRNVQSAVVIWKKLVLSL